MGRLKKELELVSSTRREIAERISKEPHRAKQIAWEYGITVSYVSFIKHRWKKYLILRQYFKDLGGD